MVKVSGLVTKNLLRSSRELCQKAGGAGGSQASVSGDTTKSAGSNWKRSPSQCLLQAAGTVGVAPPPPACRPRTKSRPLCNVYSRRISRLAWVMILCRMQGEGLGPYILWRRPNSRINWFSFLPIYQHLFSDTKDQAILFHIHLTPGLRTFNARLKIHLLQFGVHIALHNKLKFLQN